MAKSKKPGGAGSGDGYEVGYRKPPKAGQFKKGQSGNPGGRKKESQNLRTIHNKVYNEVVEAVLNSKSRSVSAREALVWREFQLGMSGDGRIIAQILNRLERFEATEPSAGVEETTEDDRAIIERAIRRRSSASKTDTDRQTLSPSDDGDPAGDGDDVNV